MDAVESDNEPLRCSLSLQSNPLPPSCYPKLSLVVSRNTECSERSQKEKTKKQKKQMPDKRGGRGLAGKEPANYYNKAATARQRPMKRENCIHLDKHCVACAKALQQEDYVAHTTVHTLTVREVKVMHMPPKPLKVRAMKIRTESSANDTHVSSRVSQQPCYCTLFQYSAKRYI